MGGRLLNRLGVPFGFALVLTSCNPSSSSSLLTAKVLQRQAIESPKESPTPSPLPSVTPSSLPLPKPSITPSPSPIPTVTPSSSPSPRPSTTPSATPTPSSSPSSCIAAPAGTYYVDTTIGLDTNNGTNTCTPWKTIARVNKAVFNAGEKVLFKRGETFYGTLIVNSSGTASAPITYGAYGSGEKPVLTGFTTLTGWTNEGGGIYSKVISSEAQTNMVSVNGVNTAMGRFPNSSYLTYESFNSNTSITDNELGTTTNWTGAEAAIRKNDWTLDRCLITNHSGNTLTYTNKGSPQSANAGFGYFIQNDLRTLDQFGEWYHNAATGKFYMYFGSVDPASKTVKVATLRNLIYNNKYDGNYIVFDNLSLMGSIENAIELPQWYTQYNTLQNSNISFSGGLGISSQSSHTTVTRNTFSDIAFRGVFINRDFALITQNTMRNIGMLEGQSPTGVNNAIHLGNSDNATVAYNTLENIGYDGIFFSRGTNISIKNNFINNVCMILNDGGGIYTGDPSTNLVIDGNIVLNSLGNTKGRNGIGYLAEGIYLDEYTAGATVINNTVAFSANGGIKLHKASNNIIRNNTSFANTKGIDFFNSLSNGSMSGNTITDNLFIAKSPTQLAMNFTTLAQDRCSFGFADNNYYARPIKDDTVIFTYEPGVNTFDRSLASWQAYSGQDIHSKKSPQAISSEADLRFEYNATNTPKTVSLSFPMIDIRGTKYSTSITLAPYTSAVLLRDANP